LEFRTEERVEVESGNRKEKKMNVSVNFRSSNESFEKGTL